MYNNIRQAFIKPYSPSSMRSVRIEFTPFQHGVNLDLTCIRLLGNGHYMYTKYEQGARLRSYSMKEARMTHHRNNVKAGREVNEGQG